MVISHRGRRTGEKENSIAAFEKAFEMGAEGIECDLRLTTDNIVVVFHDKILSSEIDNLLNLDQLLDYIKSKKKPFFLEIKNSSPILVQRIIDGIEKENLWEFVHIIGFSIVIKNALYAQENYPKLKVLPFMNFPLFSFIKIPQKSYGVFLGWIDEWSLSQFIFKTLLTPKRLKNLVTLYKNNRFKVMAGVINSESGLRYFKDAGITDIVTNEIKLASNILK